MKIFYFNYYTVPDIFLFTKIRTSIRKTNPSQDFTIWEDAQNSRVCVECENKPEEEPKIGLLWEEDINGK